MRYESAAIIAQRFNLSEQLGVLREGQNILSTQSLNVSPDSSDLLLAPMLVTAVEPEVVYLMQSTIFKACSFGRNG